MRRGALGALLALWAQAAFAQQPPQETAWDVPGLIEAVEMPGYVESQGIPVRIRAAHSSWAVQPLAQYYMDSFQKAGLYVPPPNHVKETTNNPQLTGLDVQRMIAYTVIFQIHPDHTTTVIQTSANLKLRRKAAAAGDFAPVFPGASKHVLRSSVEGLRTMSYVTSAPPDEVLKFYRDVLGKAGYAPREEEPGVYQRGNETLRVLVIKDERESTVTVTASTAGAAAPMAPP